MTIQTRKMCAEQFIKDPEAYPEYEIYLSEFPELQNPVEEVKESKSKKEK